MFAKTKYYKFDEFEFVDGKFTLTDVYFERKVQELLLVNANTSKKRQILYSRLVITLALTMFFSVNPGMAFANPCNWISEIGDSAISVVQITAVKILSIGLILELVREGLRGGSHNVSSIVTKYALLIAAVLFVPTFVTVLQKWVESSKAAL